MHANEVLLFILGCGQMNAPGKITVTSIWKSVMHTHASAFARADYGNCGMDSGLKAIWEDCYMGILMVSRKRTWPMMRPELATRQQPKSYWRSDSLMRGWVTVDQR